MQKGTVLNLRKLNFLSPIGNNKAIIAMLLLFVFGLLFGNFSCCPENRVMSFFIKNFSDYISCRQNSVFWKIFLTSLSRFFTVLAVTFICGTTFLGVSLIPFEIFCWGFWYGGISAHLCSEYAIKGIAFNAVILIPPILFFSICLFFAAKQSFLFALNLAKLTMPGSLPAKLFLQFKSYCSRYLLFVFLTIFSALIDAAMSVTFIHFFEF